MLLPRSHLVTELIMLHEHVKNYHSSIQATLSYLRRSFWIMDGRNAIRQILHKFIRCRKVDAS